MIWPWCLPEIVCSIWIHMGGYVSMTSDCYVVKRSKQHTAGRHKKRLQQKPGLFVWGKLNMILCNAYSEWILYMIYISYMIHIFFFMFLDKETYNLITLCTDHEIDANHGNSLFPNHNKVYLRSPWRLHFGEALQARTALKWAKSVHLIDLLIASVPSFLAFFFVG